MEVKCHFWAILDISQMEIPERCALFYQKIKHAGRFGICISRDPQKVTFALVSIFTSVQKVKVRGGRSPFSCWETEYEILSEPNAQKLVSISSVEMIDQ